MTLYSYNFSNDEATLVICNIDKFDGNHVYYKEIRFTLPEFFIFKPLCVADTNSKYHLILARDIKLLPGGKGIEGRVRAGIMFYDRREVTGEDVAKSLMIIIRAEEFVGNAYSLHKIKDWEINEKQAQP